jgi:hypothetical protein
MRPESFVSLFLFTTTTAAVLAACSSGEPENAGNGVNDVRAACQIRTDWARASTDECLLCLAQIQSPPCGCESEREFIGVCLSQHEAKIGEPSCDGMAKCVDGCRADCACVDACYAGKEACRRVSAASDGCAAHVCDAYCR